MLILDQKAWFLGPTIFEFHDRTDINHHASSHLTYDGTVGASKSLWLQGLWDSMIFWGHASALKASAKGQKKSEWFFQANVSSEKRTNEFNFTPMRLFFIFLEEIEDTFLKRCIFRNDIFCFHQYCPLIIIVLTKHTLCCI